MKNLNAVLLSAASCSLLLRILLGPAVISNYVVLGLAVIATLGVVLLRFQGGSDESGRHITLIPCLIFFGAFLVFLTSSALSRRFGFYQGISARGDSILIGVVLVVGLYWVAKINTDKFLSVPLLLFSQASILLLFILFTNGNVVYSDDHPAFFYRLSLLREHFPQLPFYNPDWNAGYSATEFFASGVLNVFLLTWPYLFLVSDLSTPELAHHYNYILGFIFLGLVPWTVFAAGRYISLSIPASLCAALLALGPSMGYFEWLLRYGTIGFALSAGMSVLAVCLSCRLALVPEIPRYWHAIVLILVASLCVAWTVSALIFIPVALIALCFPREVFSRERRGPILAFALVFLLLNAPWMYAYSTQAKVQSILAGSSLPGTHDRHKPQALDIDTIAEDSTSISEKLGGLLETGKQSLKLSGPLFFKINPLLLFFFLPGLFLIPQPRVRLALGATLLFLLLLTIFGEAIKPQLELRRMIVPASFLMALLAGHGIVTLLKGLETWLSTIPCSESGSLIVYSKKLCSFVALPILLGALILSPLTVAAAYLNRSDEKFAVSSDHLPKLSWAVGEFGGIGRTAVLGFILHELESGRFAAQSGGHIAPLPRFSGKEMYASDYYHRSWSRIDPIPLSFIQQGPAGIERFLDLVNATAVITHTKVWVNYCRSYPLVYTEVFNVGRFRIFQRKSDDSSFLLRGDATIERTATGLRVTPLSEEVVIKYRFVDGLTPPADGACFFPELAFAEDIGGGRTQDVFYIGIKATNDFLATGDSVSVEVDRLL